VAEPNPFKWRHYESEIILLCVRWYLRYALSYRDLEEMMNERGLSVDHTTIYRWVQRYAPELEKRSRPHLRPTNDSYRVDETPAVDRSRESGKAPFADKLDSWPISSGLLPEPKRRPVFLCPNLFFATQPTKQTPY
jgi:hypothetical protein